MSHVSILPSESGGILIGFAHRVTCMIISRKQPRLCAIMVPRVVALPAEATVLEACEFFVLYKFLALPVIDDERRVIGIVDTHVFMQSVLENDETSREGVRDDFFEALGFHLAEVRD